MVKDEENFLLPDVTSRNLFHPVNLSKSFDVVCITVCYIDMSIPDEPVYSVLCSSSFKGESLAATFHDCVIDTIASVVRPGSPIIW